MKFSSLALSLIAAASFAPCLVAVAQQSDRRWDIELGGFSKRGGTLMPFYLYGYERSNQWVSVVGSSRGAMNRSFHYVDMSKAPVVDGKIKGPVTIHFIPDFWVPFNHQTYTILIDLDASVSTDGQMTGAYKITAVNTTDASKEVIGTGGNVKGKATAFLPATPEKASFLINLADALPGGKPEYGERFLVLRLHLDGNKLLSASRGRMTMNKAYVVPGRLFPFAPPSAAVIERDADALSVKIVVPDETLDGDKAEYAFDIQGRIMEKLFVGLYQLVITTADGKSTKRSGGFYGQVDPLADAEAVTATAPADERPWSKPVAGYKPPAAGEHPRLLFRKSDLAALRQRAETPVGKAILTRLRKQLNGGDGEALTTMFGTKGAVTQDGAGPHAGDPIGTYTISHVAGYGLLYQITGDKKYAELGKQCFEKAVEGYRDRDQRYSFLKPYGALRAGPSLGWMAVGYDLCYDGWDDATREKFGRIFAEYNEGGKLELETLARGTMPPGSNHFGMQVGGAALALMAVSGETWADQKKIDSLLKVSERSMIRNLSEGFGDGGFFAEGDGTGSMSSQIVFLSALQAWKTAMGKDFINVERANARMMTLKWIYLTVMRNGRPDFSPIRGGYGQNVWSRTTMSGAGYFAIGLGGVTEEQKAALLWYYNHFLLAGDEKAGAPYDTVSVYPHLSISAFVNWPLGMAERNPAQVLPLCYRDSVHGFYAWRNRWQDENDIVISILTSRTQGYMGAKAEGSLKVAAFGKKFDWGKFGGEVVNWSTSPHGETSVMTLHNGVSAGVDFTGASGADAMLVTTGAAEGQTVKLGTVDVTFKFLTTDKEPTVRVDGTHAIVGKQDVSLKDRNLVFAVTTPVASNR